MNNLLTIQSLIKFILLWWFYDPKIFEYLFFSILPIYDLLWDYSSLAAGKGIYMCKFNTDAFLADSLGILPRVRWTKKVLISLKLIDFNFNRYPETVVCMDYRYCYRYCCCIMFYQTIQSIHSFCRGLIRCHFIVDDEEGLLLYDSNNFCWRFLITTSITL
jgi:hypothetical protein